MIIRLPFTGKRTGAMKFDPADRMRVVDEATGGHGYRVLRDTYDWDEGTVEVEIIFGPGEPIFQRLSDGLVRKKSAIPDEELFATPEYADFKMIGRETWTPAVVFREEIAIQARMEGKSFGQMRAANHRQNDKYTKWVE